MNTHRAVIESSVLPAMEIVAAGDYEYCRTALLAWLNKHPLDGDDSPEYACALIVKVEHVLPPIYPPMTTADYDKVLPAADETCECGHTKSHHDTTGECCTDYCPCGWSVVGVMPSPGRRVVNSPQMCQAADLIPNEPDCLRLGRWTWQPEPDDHPVLLCNFHAEPLLPANAFIPAPADQPETDEPDDNELHVYDGLPTDADLAEFATCASCSGRITRSSSPWLHVWNGKRWCHSEKAPGIAAPSIAAAACPAPADQGEKP